MKLRIYLFICDKPYQIFRYLIDAREAIKLAIGAMILVFGGYILVREAKKLVRNACILAFDGYILVREAKNLAIDEHILVCEEKKLLVIANS